MRLADALRLKPGQVVAFTGAGGKSTCLRKLATELAGELPVVLTTTTKILHDQTDLASSHLIMNQPQAMMELRRLLRTQTSVLLTGRASAQKKKWFGLDIAQLDKVREIVREAGGVLIIEADGARGCSLKAPATHEPVIPPFADLVVPIAGLDVIGEKIDSGLVHRSERVRALLNAEEDKPLSTRQVAAILGARNGGLKGVPQDAKVKVLLNKALQPARREYGRDIAARLLENVPRVQAILLAEVASQPAVVEVFSRVAGIVLAAGGSTRMNQPKQLALWHGHPLIWYAVKAALDGGLSPVVVVLGAAAEEVQRSLANLPVHFVVNSEWQAGQSTSVRAGLEAIEEEAEATLLLLSDMPLVTADLVQALVAKHRCSLSPIVVPFHGEQRGNPVLFDRATFPRFREIEGNKGGRALFGKYPMEKIQWDSSVLFDVDTSEDLRILESME